MDKEFLRLCREAAYYIAQYADKNRSGTAPEFLRDFLPAIEKAEARLAELRAVPLPRASIVPCQENADDVA